MKFNPELHHRHSIRLQGFDYSSPGYYFITICTQNREFLLGTIDQKRFEFNDSGKMVKTGWIDLTKRFKHIRLDNFVIMPNHLHGIIQIKGILLFKAITDYFKNRIETVNDFELVEPINGTAENSIGRIIQAFKSITTVNYCLSVREHNWPSFDKQLWQKNFYDHIIRDTKELEHYRRYILDNPANWQGDEDNPINFR